MITVTASACNILLNYVLIRLIGMPGAAIATALSHGLQLTLHHLYCSLHIGKGSYPFPVPLWIGYLAAYLIVMGITYAASGIWLLRWGLGAFLGIWELYRIYKRKTLF